MQTLGSLLLPVEGHGQRVVSIFRGAGRVAFLQTDALAALHVDRGNELRSRRRGEQSVIQSAPDADEIAQQPLAHRLALLRVKLRAPHRAAPGYRAETDDRTPSAPAGRSSSAGST